MCILSLGSLIAYLEPSQINKNADPSPNGRTPVASLIISQKFRTSTYPTFFSPIFRFGRRSPSFLAQLLGSHLRSLSSTSEEQPKKGRE